MKIYAAIFALTFCLVGTAYADDPIGGLIDAIMKVYGIDKQYLPELDNLKDIKDIQGDIKNNLDKNLQGNFGYAGLYNQPQDLDKRQWSNDSWVDVLNESNNGKSSAFYEAQESYRKLYQIAPADHIGRSLKDDSLTRTYYRQASSISRAALAASSFSYDQINDHIQVIHDMLEKLDQQPSEIAAVQLNARLTAEVGFIELELLKQATIQNQLSATSTQNEVNGMSDASDFMQWDPN